jgi:hypothetical protein
MTARLFVITWLIWLSGCQSEAPVAPANSPTAQASAMAGALEVTYLANEGFMIAGGGRKVLQRFSIACNPWDRFLTLSLPTFWGCPALCLVITQIFSLWGRSGL